MSKILHQISYMQQAIKEAKKAYKKDEVPIGAIVVNATGTIIGKGHNLVETLKQQQAHAECRAIAHACKKIGDWRLEGCWLYVTLEPCAMCMNLVLLTRLTGIVFGASSPVFGFALDNEGPIQLYRRKKIQIIPGVCKQESETLLKNFFKEKRNACE